MFQGHAGGSPWTLGKEKVRMATLEIELGRIGKEVIRLDGADIGSAIWGITLDADAGEVPQLTLRLPIVDRTTLSSEWRTAVLIPAETRDLLVRLGWTPPVEGLSTETVS